MGRFISAVCVLGLFSASVVAVPVYYAENGHYYERIDRERNTGCTWHVAKAEAEALSYEEVQGHLVTITSQEEHDFIVANLGDVVNVIHHWIGGYQYDQADEPDEGWGWVTGEAWDFTNWKSDNPDNDWGSHGYFGGSPDGSDEEALTLWDPDARWNDADEWGELKGYIVEYDVPGPATLPLLAVGGWALLRRRRK